MWSAISTELLVADERSRPFISSMARGDLTWVGLDVHKDSIQMGILRRGSDAVEQRAIFHDEASVHKAFVRGLGPRSRLRVCDEAGPTGYGLACQLQQMGIACQVIAPSLIPKAPGDKVKTDLFTELPGGRAGLHPDPHGPRRCGARPVPGTSRHGRGPTRARNRLSKFLLRHSVVWRGGSTWTLEHHRWLEPVADDAAAIDRPAACLGRSVTGPPAGSG